MIARILSILFPPKLPGRIENWAPPSAPAFQEQGWAGNVRRQFTGIEKHWMMHPETEVRRSDRKRSVPEQRTRQTQINTKLDAISRADFEKFGRLQRLTLAGPPKTS